MISQRTVNDKRMDMVIERALNPLTTGTFLQIIPLKREKMKNWTEYHYRRGTCQQANLI